MDVVDALPVILVVSAFAICFGYLLKEYVQSKWS